MKHNVFTSLGSKNTCNVSHQKSQQKQSCQLHNGHSSQCCIHAFVTCSFYKRPLLNFHVRSTITASEKKKKNLNEKIFLEDDQKAVFKYRSAPVLSSV